MLLQQAELFPVPAGFTPHGDRKGPRLWVKELRVYRVFAPGGQHDAAPNLLRRIVLRPGLNILWAKPRNPARPGERTARGVSGHATGKTTFCRFIRYLLGESTFGNDDQRSRLRSAFPEGWVVGEVHLEGTPWLICRPMIVGGKHHAAYRGRTMETLFKGEEGRQTIEEYRHELTKLLAEPLPVASFATSPTPIEWPHILQWLTRDQECRFSGLAELRHATSDSQSPAMLVEDIHFLFRALLGLIDTKEQAELEINKDLLKRKNEAEHNAPLLRFRGESAYKRLREQLNDYRLDLAHTDFLDTVHREWKKLADDFAAQLKTIEEPESLRNAKQQVQTAELERAKSKERKKELERNLAFTEQQILQLKGDISKAQFNAWMKDNMPSEHDCGRTLQEAIEWECPLAVGRTLPKVGRPRPVPTAGTEARLEEQKSRDKAQIERFEKLIKEQDAVVAEATKAQRKEYTAYDQYRAGLTKEEAKHRTISEEANRAYEDLSAAERLESSLKELEQGIQDSRDKQASLRDQQIASLAAFSDTFNRLVRAIIDRDVTGTISFHGRKVKPSLENGIDMTSAALETLKIICFDLATLISGVEGRGHHPLFLIHDGPREADMDADLYHQIFRVIRELEQSFRQKPICFQYIVTTTEPPPAQLTMEPWLLDPVLDASSIAGKFLRRNF